MKTILAVLALGILLFLGAGPVLAETADGATQAGETICDGLSGAQWGLCNAYCEAMNCDSADAHASQNACDKVRMKFEEKSGGAAPPCEGSVECTAWTAEEMDDAFTTIDPDLAAIECTDGTNQEFVATYDENYAELAIGLSPEGWFGSVRCADPLGPPAVIVCSGRNVIFGIPSSEVEACKALLRQSKWWGMCP